MTDLVALPAVRLRVPRARALCGAAALALWRCARRMRGEQRPRQRRTRPALGAGRHRRRARDEPPDGGASWPGSNRARQHLGFSRERGRARDERTADLGRGGQRRQHHRGVVSTHRSTQSDRHCLGTFVLTAGAGSVLARARPEATTSGSGGQRHQRAQPASSPPRRQPPQGGVRRRSLRGWLARYLKPRIENAAGRLSAAPGRQDTPGRTESRIPAREQSSVAIRPHVRSRKRCVRPRTHLRPDRAARVSRRRGQLTTRSRSLPPVILRPQSASKRP